VGLRNILAVTPSNEDGSASGPSRGVFVTRESLTFPGSAALVTFLLQLADVPFKGAKTSFWWALGVSFVLGGVIYYFSLTTNMTRKQKIEAGVIAVLNILVLTGTALGVGSLTSSNAVSLTPTPSPTP
jgi:hypothetical protein